MKVSIVIPAYNEEAGIGASIRAAMAQNYSDFEVIVVNNASTDSTAQVVAGFPVRLVQEGRKGLLWAREAGRVAAKGDIIANIDADCLPEPDWLSRGARLFEDSRISAATGPYDYYDAGGFFRLTSLFTQKYIYRFFNFVLQLFGQGAVMIGGNNFIRAVAIQKEGGYNTDLTFYGEDTDTAKRAAKQGRVVFDRSLVMKTSARRFKKEGVIALEAKYIYHFFKQIFARSKKTEKGA